MKLNSHKDIKIAQFYRADAANGYYYVGVIFGNRIRLSCINIGDSEIEDGDNFLPDSYVKDWLLVECSQEEAMKCV